MEELQAVVERLGGAAELVGDRMGCPELTDDIRTLCDAVTLMGCGHAKMNWNGPDNVSGQTVLGYCAACRSQQEAVAAAEQAVWLEVVTDVEESCVTGAAIGAQLRTTQPKFGKDKGALSRYVSAQVAERTAELQRELTEAKRDYEIACEGNMMQQEIRDQLRSERDAAQAELTALRTRMEGLVLQFRDKFYVNLPFDSDLTRGINIGYGKAARECRADLAAALSVGAETEKENNNGIQV